MAPAWRRFRRAIGGAIRRGEECRDGRRRPYSYEARHRGPTTSIILLICGSSLPQPDAYESALGAVPSSSRRHRMTTRRHPARAARAARQRRRLRPPCHNPRHIPSRTRNAGGRRAAPVPVGREEQRPLAREVQTTTANRPATSGTSSTTVGRPCDRAPSKRSRPLVQRQVHPLFGERDRLHPRAPRPAPDRRACPARSTA